MDDVKFCVRCGHALEIKMVSGKVRPACPQCGRVHFFDPKVAVGLVVERDGQLLLIRRNNDPQKGKWSIPAGYVDRGEDPARAAEREGLEETGLALEVTGLLGVYGKGDDSEGADVLIVYHARAMGGLLQPGDDADEVGYFPPGELPELAFASTQQIIERWQKR